MPTAKPRITITLEPHSHEVLSRLSAASGDSMSQIVAGFVDLALPSLERVVVVLEQARAAPQEVRAGLAASFERAERDLMPAILGTIKQTDMFLADVQAQSAPPAPARREHAQRAAPGRGKGSAKRSTPPALTGGSGGPAGGRKGVRRGTL